MKGLRILYIRYLPGLCARRGETNICVFLSIYIGCRYSMMSGGYILTLSLPSESKRNKTEWNLWKSFLTQHLNCVPKKRSEFARFFYAFFVIDICFLIYAFGKQKSVVFHDFRNVYSWWLTWMVLCAVWNAGSPPLPLGMSSRSMVRPLVV